MGKHFYLTICLNKKYNLFDYYNNNSFSWYRTALKIITEKLAHKNTNQSKQSLLDEFLRSNETDFKDVVGMTVDTLLAGIDTVL